MTTAVVIGAGIAGLATAALMQREGYDVTVLEQGTEVGGRAGSWQQDDFRFDTGPSWYLMPEVFDHFFRLLGTSSTEQLTLQPLDPAYRVYFEGDAAPTDVPRGRDAVAQLFEQIEPGAGRRVRQYLDSAAAAYRMALDQFLYTTFASYRPLINRRLLRSAWRLARLLAQPLDRFVAQSFTDRRLRQILGYPAVFLGSSPDRTPSLYHLMSHLDLDDGVWYPAGGIHAVIRAIADLAHQEGVTVRTATRAVSISVDRAPRGTHVTGVVATDADGVTKTYPADVVVSAADVHHTETELVPAGLRTYPERWWRTRSPGPGAVLVYLGIRGSLPQLAHHTLMFTRDWTDNFDAIFTEPTRIPHPASAYVCKPSATDDTVAPAGHENVFMLIPVPADPSIGRGGATGSGADAVEAIANAGIDQLAAWADIPDLNSRIVVRRTVGPEDFASEFHAWRGGALGPAHTLRQSAFFRASNASTTIDGLFYAGGSTIPGVGLPMCLISAELVIKRLRGDTGTSPLDEPSHPRRSYAGPAARRRLLGRAVRDRAGASMAERREPGMGGWGMTRYAREERWALCDTLRRVGPDSPTLCEGWESRDLLVHLLIRERRPDASAGAMVSLLSGHRARVEADLADQDWGHLVDMLGDGPPAWSPFALPAFDEAANLGEFFVHHEDVRRAQDGFEVRELGPGVQRALWKTIGRTARFLLRDARVGMIAEVPGVGQQRLRRASGTHGDVTLRGWPSELVLYVFGRGRVADVAIDGAASDLEALRAVILGI